MFKLKKWIKSYWDEITAYLLTFWCTMLSPFLPVLESGDKVKLLKDISTIIFYATIALFLTFAQEYIIPEKIPNPKMTNEEKRIAKRKHIIKRFIFAMAFGFGAPTAVHKVLCFLFNSIGV